MKDRDKKNDKEKNSVRSKDRRTDNHRSMEMIFKRRKAFKCKMKETEEVIAIKRRKKKIVTDRETNKRKVKNKKKTSTGIETETMMLIEIRSRKRNTRRIDRNLDQEISTHSVTETEKIVGSMKDDDS